ncbi:MAG: dihydrolipoyl dehydrogenase [Rikenellaceae bacterium]
MNFDIIIIGSGPGGYVAAIRASQLGLNTAIIERAELGGVCLNWGCIPTKALLRSAHALEEIRHASSFGIDITGEVEPNFSKIIERSRSVSKAMSSGVQFLLKKNKVTVINGSGKLAKNNSVEVTNSEGETATYTADKIIIATGARAKMLPNIPIDGTKIISYREALTLESLPESMVVIGSGAIGVELASFYHSLGVKVTVIEYLPNIVPTEDEEISKYLERSFRKAKLGFMTKSSVTHVDTTQEKCVVTVLTPKGEQLIECDKVLSAVGVQPNIENLGLEELEIVTDKGKIVVNDDYETSVKNIYAIGDVIPTISLAHVASAEAINCVEKIAGLSPKKIDYNNVPSCIYTSPEISSVGLKEAEAIEKGYEIKIGKFPYTASGKATAMGNKDGFIKLIFDAKSDKLLGAHFIGTNVTEMIMEATLSLELGATAKQILSTIHPHPTLSEAIMEAAAAAHGEVIHL